MSNLVIAAKKQKKSNIKIERIAKWSDICWNSSMNWVLACFAIPCEAGSGK